MIRINRFLPWFYLLLTGVLSGISFMTEGSTIAGFLSFIPALFLADNFLKNLKNAVYWGIALSISITVFTASWLISTIAIYGHIPYPLAIVVFILFGTISSSRFILFFILVYLFKKADSLKPMQKYKINDTVAWLIFWGISEYFSWQLFPVYGANFISQDLLLIQCADLVGVGGVSLLWFSANLALYKLTLFFYQNKFKTSPHIFFSKNKGSLVTLSLILIAHIYGYYSLKYWSTPQNNTQNKNVAVIQGNTPLAFENIRDIKSYIYSIADGMKNQTLSLIEKSKILNEHIDLIVWPESAVPFLSYQDSEYYREIIQSIQREYPVSMIFNDIYYNNVNRNKYYNNMWMIDSNGIESHNYQKMLLLPFAEFIPLGNFFPVLYDLVPEISGFTPSKKRNLLASGIGMILPSICYELLPADFTLSFFQATGSKAQLIINITNDKWFGAGRENYQHLEASKMRAIELRLPVIRSTNSGISAMILPSGVITGATESDKKESRIYSVPVPEKSVSFFSKTGYWPHKFIYISFLLVWIWTLYVNKIFPNYLLRKR